MTTMTVQAAQTVQIDDIRRERAGQTSVELTGVGKSFGSGAGAVTALRGVDLRGEHGEFVCLLGASGCGKSTLLNLLAGLDAPTQGEVRVNAPRPSLMFQESALLPWLTAGRNIELPLQLDGWSRGKRRD